MSTDNQDTGEEIEPVESEHDIAERELAEFADQAKEELGIGDDLRPIDEETEDVPETEEIPAASDDSDDGSVEEDGEDTEDFNDDVVDEQIDEDAYRTEFAEEYGFTPEAVSDHTPEQLELWGKELDRRAMDRAEAQIPQPPQQFEAPRPQQFEQQQMPVSPVQEAYETMKAQAEEAGMDTEFMSALDAQYEANLRTEQMNQGLFQQQQQQHQAAIAAEEEGFDNAVDRLDMPKLFGKDRQDAFSKEETFNARRDLYQKAKHFAAIEGKPLSAGLIKRVASVLFDGQIKETKKQGVVNKARKQSRKRLGTGKLGTSKSKRRTKETDTGDERIDNLMDDPDFAAFAEDNEIPMHSN